MSRHAATQDPLHVLYLGTSADLGALRRRMEAHGAVTRSRLTPAVVVVIADSSVAAEHPTLRAASMLGIPVLDPAEAIHHFAAWQRSRTDVPLPVPSPVDPPGPIRPAPVTARRSWRFRRSAP